MTDPKKASNALVAVVDLYASIVGDLLAVIAEKDRVIQRLGEQLRKQSGGVGDERRTEDGAGNGA